MTKKQSNDSQSQEILRKSRTDPDLSSVPPERVEDRATVSNTVPPSDEPPPKEEKNR